MYLIGKGRYQSQTYPIRVPSAEPPNPRLFQVQLDAIQVAPDSETDVGQTEPFSPTVPVSIEVFGQITLFITSSAMSGMASCQVRIWVTQDGGPKIIAGQLNQLQLYVPSGETLRQTLTLWAAGITMPEGATSVIGVDVVTDANTTAEVNQGDIIGNLL